MDVVVCGLRLFGEDDVFGDLCMGNDVLGVLVCGRKGEPPVGKGIKKGVKGN